MTACESTDFLFPMLADIYYPLVEQGAYGNVKRNWVLDKSIACQLNKAGTANKQDIRPEVKLLQDSSLVGRVRTDIRISSDLEKNALTNILLTNVRDKHGNVVYLETSGPRSGQPTIFEFVTFEPLVGPFGHIEYYQVVIKRSENQGTDL